MAQRNKKGQRADGLLQKGFRFNGRLYTVYGHSQQELDEKAVKKREELSQKKIDFYDPTLSVFYDELTERRKQEVKGSTIRSQRFQFKCISEATAADGRCFGDFRLSEITRRDIEYVRKKLKDEGKSPEHLNICFAHLSHVLHDAALNDLIEKNPCKGLKALKRTAPAARDTIHRALSYSETDAFFKAAGERNSFYSNHIKLMLHTGMRTGEIAALYPTDIDRRSGFIHVRRTVTRDECGSYIVSDMPKTESSIRDIPLTDNMLAIIRAQQKLNLQMFGGNTEGLIFKSAEGTILRDYMVTREINRICKAAGIDHFASHALRHTFATRFIEQRPQDFKILSEILGHKKISITLDLYSHVMNDNKILAMNSISVMKSA